MTTGASASTWRQPVSSYDRRSASIDVNDFAVELAIGTTLEQCGLRLADNDTNTTYSITDSLFDAQKAPANAIWIVEPEPVPSTAAIGALTNGTVAAVVARPELDRLPFVLQSLYTGFAPLPQSLVVSAQRLPAGLTLRQHELLAHMAQGETQDLALSHKLNCASATIRRDISSACTAFSLPGRRDLADAARAYGYTHATWTGFLSYLCGEGPAKRIGGPAGLG